MTDKKLIVVVAIITGFILIGGIFFFSRGSESEIPQEDVVSTNGLHWHPKLFIFIKGEKQEIPADVGILPTKHEEIHTHEDVVDGIIHMEMSGVVTRDETRLGRFFEIWEKEFSFSQIFEFKNSSSSSVKMFVNGMENNDFENYEMRDGDLIEIKYE